jgi:TRAP-type C4-dicarboxylate transport system permease small subunit
MNNLSRFIIKITNSKSWHFLLKIQRLVMLFTSIVMLSILGIVVFARYALHMDVFGYDELVLIDSFWMYFIGASYAMYEGSHVKADILSRLYSKHIQALMKVIAGFCQTVINIIFNIFAFSMIMRSAQTMPMTASWNIPFLVPQMSILVGFTLMTFYLFIYTLIDLNNYLNIINNQER